MVLSVPVRLLSCCLVALLLARLLLLRTLLLLPVVLGLGFWQLERAAEKRRYEAAYLARLADLPVPVSTEVEAFQRVRLTGEFDPKRYFLLDNQIRQGKVGFAVLAVFVTTDGRQWLLNRGFVAGHQGRSRLPSVRISM